ncbi:glycine--tRNA ligase [archaeon]|nr:glycine--tRNA ligase [archaeon]|tara:strand:+ start:1307 stop:2812 length:1506 start_codon:yes stop_codon:yes gene_type:complete
MNISKSEKITNIATKRGFFFPTAEIYNAISGFWTYGHLGTLMKRKFENLWRDYFLKLNDNFYEIEGSNILPQKVFKASGHLDHFNDPLTECRKCHFRFRADQLIEDELNINAEEYPLEKLDKILKKEKLSCPKCSSQDFQKTKSFNMMFDLKVGSTGTEISYLSPETAQNPFLSFKREYYALRETLPFGLAKIGKAFRNEISPRQGFFRLREFTQAELQIFFNPDKLDEAESWNKIKNYKLQLYLSKNNKITLTSCENANKKLNLPKLYLYYLAKTQQFYLDTLKIPKAKFRLRELSEKERAFYNKIHFDIELDLETLKGWKEVAGIHYRTDYDLEKHQKASGEKLEVLNEGKRFFPHVIELSFGVDRNIWSLLDIFFKEEKERTLFTLPTNLVPVEVAVFPLVNKDNLPKRAIEVYNSLKDKYQTFYDFKGAIGKMYRRMDEIGCPIMLTIDHQTLKNNTVTLREIKTMKQIRINIKKLESTIEQILQGQKLNKFGKYIS